MTWRGVRKSGAEIRGLFPALALGLFFLWPLILLQKSFILYDFAAQHLPWAKVAFEALRAGQLPLWTFQMGGGFPLFAEGQVGVLYLPHLALYGLLPFLAAYTWSIPLHFLAGILGCYVYLRALGLGRGASGIATASFAFGSAYAGACYNAGSLRTLCWVPWVLWCFEKARRHTPGAGRWKWWSVVAFLTALQWTAGFSQMAVYAFGYVSLHEVFAGLEKGTSRVEAVARAVGRCALILGLGTLMALPQVVPTIELIGQSVRQGESAAFALWGSVPPTALIGLIFPEWGGALRIWFYIGILPIFFVLAGFWIPGRCSVEKRHGLLAVVFLLLAIGRHNPLYAFAVEHGGLASLRNPAKFLFFVALSLSVMAAFGIERCVKEVGNERSRKKLARGSWAFLIVTMTMPLVGSGLTALFGSGWPVFSRWYVARLVAEKGSSAGDPAEYLRRMEAFFEGLGRLFSYSNYHNLLSIVLAATAVFAVWLLWRRVNQKIFWVLVAGIVMADLGIYGHTFGTGFIGNAGSLGTLQPSPWLRTLQKTNQEEPGLFAEGMLDSGHALLAPNAGLYYGIPEAGGYSPLLLKRYHNLVYELGISDSSLGHSPINLKIWRARRALLDLIGARYLHVDRPLDDWEDLALVAKDAEGKRYLYRNARATPELWGVYEWKSEAQRDPATKRSPWEDWDPSKTAWIEGGASQLHGFVEKLPTAVGAPVGLQPFRREYQMEMIRDGLAVTRTASYPGWSVRVNGARVNPLIVNRAFIGFWLSEGKHRVVLEYRPTHWAYLWILCGAGWIFWALTMCFCWGRRKLYPAFGI